MRTRSSFAPILCQPIDSGDNRCLDYLDDHSVYLEGHGWRRGGATRKPVYFSADLKSRLQISDIMTAYWFLNQDVCVICNSE